MLRTLIVDDSELMRKRLVSILSDFKQVEVVAQAEDGAEAVALIHQHHPDLVLLDIRMPRLNGLGVLAQIRREVPETTMVIFTNYPHSQYRTRCVKLGADHFLDKSKDLGVLMEIVKDLIRHNSHKL